MGGGCRKSRTDFKFSSRRFHVRGCRRNHRLVSTRRLALTAAHRLPKKLSRSNGFHQGNTEYLFLGDGTIAGVEGSGKLSGVFQAPVFIFGTSEVFDLARQGVGPGFGVQIHGEWNLKRIRNR